MIAPAVSVIIPVYNEQAYLASCLDTVFGQSLQNIEVLCVDDGSMDDSLNILHEYAKKDSRLRIFSDGKIGVGPARNLGIKHAQGEFISFMDADDRYPEQYTLEKLYHTAKEQDVLICGGSFSTSSEDSEEPTTHFKGIMAPYTFSKNELWDFVDYQFPYGYQRFLFSRKFLLDKNIMFPDYERFQDPPFMIHAMIEAKTFYAISDITYYYRRHHRSVDWDTKKNTDFLRGIENCLKLTNLHSMSKLHCFVADVFTSQYIQVLDNLSKSDKNLKYKLFKICSMLHYKNLKINIKLRLVKIIMKQPQLLIVFYPKLFTQIYKFCF